MTAPWTRSPQVLWRRVAGGVLLLAPRDAEPLLVTGSGAAVWELLESPLGVEELAERLAETFDVSTEEAAAGAAPFLADLVDRGIVTASP